jgi:hypothetical protein
MNSLLSMSLPFDNTHTHTHQPTRTPFLPHTSTHTQTHPHVQTNKKRRKVVYVPNITDSRVTSEFQPALSVPLRWENYHTHDLAPLQPVCSPAEAGVSNRLLRTQLLNHIHSAREGRRTRSTYIYIYIYIYIYMCVCVCVCMCVCVLCLCGVLLLSLGRVSYPSQIIFSYLLFLPSLRVFRCYGLSHV